MPDLTVHLCSATERWLLENQTHIPGLKETVGFACGFLKRDAALGRALKDGRKSAEYPRDGSIPGLRKIVLVYSVVGDQVRISGVWDKFASTGLIEATGC
ncbi:MAG: hypothetical protein H7Z12_07575 [Rhodospirillaceae bacterium]|nr:hypothetical protein [Rhodospirillales bacterium]